MDEEHIHPSWMVIPVGNLAGAVTAMLVDRDYIDWGWFQFSLGTLLWLALWPTTFRKVHTRVHFVLLLWLLWSASWRGFLVRLRV